MSKFCLPQDITPEIFLRDYWQKKPLLIRGGLPEIVGQLEPDDNIAKIIGNCSPVRYPKRTLQTCRRNGLF